MKTETGNAITLRFALPSERLRPYVTTYYLIEAQTSETEPVIEDYLHPEWPNLRFLKDDWASSAVGEEPLRATPAFSVTGPTTKATQFRIGKDAGRGGGAVKGGNWGIGLLPLGWAKLIGAPANEYADRFIDGNADPAFEPLRALGAKLSTRFHGETRDFASEVALIEECLKGLLEREVPHEEQITAINAALVDPDIASASQLAERVGMNLRSLERLSRRAFGFPPKLLLRRQRFLRSLAQFMLDPSLKWLSTLDYQYHDQAHFVRDFKRFMGMTPGQYAKLEKPILVAAAQARMAIAGEAVQGLHDPKS
ncbi:MAG: AraC family transcriptional regulator [Erythrobacter sp.]|nr:AraC family transcriptional regulator [Erythrobacter sp.]